MSYRRLVPRRARAPGGDVGHVVTVGAEPLDEDAAIARSSSTSRILTTEIVPVGRATGARRQGEIGRVLGRFLDEPRPGVDAASLRWSCRAAWRGHRVTKVTQA